MTDALPAGLRREAIRIEAEWHDSYLCSRDQREWQHSREAEAIAEQARDLLREASTVLTGDAWALLETLEDVQPGMHAAEAAWLLATGGGGDWVAGWIEAARQYAAEGL